jgi:(p)ppGpp synthase/HD superfamily hydrolase
MFSFNVTPDTSYDNDGYGRLSSPLIVRLFDRFDRLISRVCKNEEQLQKVDQAFTLMIAAHAEQETRADGIAYVHHPLSVAIVSVEEFGVTDSDTVCAALLHDVIEDQASTVGECLSIPECQHEQSDEARAAAIIESVFGARVRQYVELLTNPDFKAKASELYQQGDTRDTGTIVNALYKEHFFHIFDHSPEAFKIKLADFSMNALDIERLKASPKKEKLKKKYGPVLKDLIPFLKDHPEIHCSDAMIRRMKLVYNISYKED